MLEIRRRRLHRNTESFPRTKINNKGGDRKAFIDVTNHYDLWRTGIRWRLINKFLSCNIGRHIDKVYPEFLKRLRKGTYVRHGESLREYLMDYFVDKEKAKEVGGYYLSNGIINHYPRPEHLKYYYYNPKYPQNFNLAPKEMMPFVKRLEFSNEPIYIGDFFVDETTNKTQVYIGYKESYKKGYYTGYRQTFVNGYWDSFVIEWVYTGYPPLKPVKRLVQYKSWQAKDYTVYVFLMKGKRKK